MEENKNLNVNDSSDSEEEEFKHPLEDQFVSMFPHTPRRYIRNRLANLPDNPEAVARFTEELLNNPAQAAGSGNDSDDDELDEEIDQWKDVKQSEMRGIFPDLCPDWLMETLDNITDNAKAIADPSDKFEEMEKMVSRKADEILSLTDADRAKLPTVKAWRERRQLQEELEMWSVGITAKDMVDLYEDPANHFFGVERKPETPLYRRHSLARLREEFRFQKAQQIEKIFRRNRFFFAPARRALLLRQNDRKTRRPDKDVGFPPQPCLAFIKERRFCELEEEINREVEMRRLTREQMRMEARDAGLLEECVICLASDCLPLDMISCQAGHKFCKNCVIITAEGVLARGKGMVQCLRECDLELDVNQLKRVLKPIVLSKLMVNKQAEELKTAGVENLVGCPFCPYQTIMDNLEDKVMRCLNPECGRDSCKMCKLSNHIPYSCKEYREEVLASSRRKIEEELTMSWVRQCWNCNVDFEREGGCNVMTCPRCGKKTCYACRKDANTGFHPGCNRIAYQFEKRLHQKELTEAEEKIKSELTHDQEETLQDLFKPSTSK